MATIQDIQALESQIYDAIEEYLDAPESYNRPTLHVFLDKDDMEYRAEMDDDLKGTEDDGIYPAGTLVREGEDGPEPDIDRINDIANSWIFLD